MASEPALAPPTVELAPSARRLDLVWPDGVHVRLRADPAGGAAWDVGSGCGVVLTLSCSRSIAHLRLVAPAGSAPDVAGRADAADPAHLMVPPAMVGPLLDLSVSAVPLAARRQAGAATRSRFLQAGMILESAPASPAADVAAATARTVHLPLVLAADGRISVPGRPLPAGGAPA